MRLAPAVIAAALLATPAPAAAASDPPPRVLFVTAHPDDETLFNLGRFAERPVRVGGPAAPLLKHKRGLPVWKQKQLKKQQNSD